MNAKSVISYNAINNHHYICWLNRYQSVLLHDYYTMYLASVDVQATFVGLQTCCSPAGFQHNAVSRLGTLTELNSLARKGKECK